MVRDDEGGCVVGVMELSPDNVVVQWEIFVFFNVDLRGGFVDVCHAYLVFVFVNSFYVWFLVHSLLSLHRGQHNSQERGGGS